MNQKREQAEGEITLSEAAEYLAQHPDSTGFDLKELALVPNALDPPQELLRDSVDPDRVDLVEEFRASPLGPHSLELRHLLWNLRAQSPAGSYVLSRVAGGGWRVLHLMGMRRPRGEPVPGPVYETLEDAEWGIFTVRWRDHTGCVLPSERGPG